MTSYAEQIDHQISLLRAEIDRLQTAKDVISQLDGKSKPVLTLKANIPSKSNSITIRRVAETPAGTKPRKLGEGRAMTKRIVAALTVRPELASGDIIASIGVKEKGDKQRVYAALNSLVKGGKLNRDDDGFYSLIVSTSPAPEEVRQPDEVLVDG